MSTVWLVPAFPLVGALLNIFFGRLTGHRAHWIAVPALAGSFLVTTAISVPLNEELVDAGDPAAIADLAAVRDDFEGTWVAWNMVRTALGPISVVCQGPQYTRPAAHQRPCSS